MGIGGCNDDVETCDETSVGRAMTATTTVTPDDLVSLSRWAEHRYETDQLFRYKADRAARLAHDACPVEVSETCRQAMLIGAIVALYLEGAKGSSSVDIGLSLRPNPIPTSPNG
jgi:hypothetical protein